LASKNPYSISVFEQFTELPGGKSRLIRSYVLENAKKPVVTGFFAQNGWLVAVYDAGTVLAYSKARAWVGVGSAMR